MRLPTATVSFRSFLQRCLGKLFKLRQVSTSSPVAWATSNSLSRDKPPPEACKYCMVNGDDTIRWPRPPSEVEVIFDFYFFGTLTLWRHHFFHLDEKADICFDGNWKIWGRAGRLQPGRGGFSRTTKYQLFEQVDRWLARVGKERQGGAAVVVAGGAAAQWFQMKPAKIDLPTVISRIFQIKIQQIHLISVSGHCKCFIFKMCQNVAAICITSQFHEFLNLILGGFLSFETSVCRNQRFFRETA